MPGSIVSLEPAGVCAGWNPATGLVGADLEAPDSFRTQVVPNAFVASVFVFLVLLVYLPSLWNLVDRRYQTLYDKLCGVVVIND